MNFLSQSSFRFKIQYLLRNSFSDNQKWRIAKSWNTGAKLTEDYQKLNCLFIHIPKAGGSSIHQSIAGDTVGLGHHSAREYQYIYPSFFEGAYKFSIVRNPYTRLASAYYFLKKGGNNAYCQWFSSTHLSPFQSFSDFVDALGHNRKLQNWIHFVPQNYFLVDLNDKPMVNFIGKFENLEGDHHQICSTIGLSSKLGHVNPGSFTGSYLDSIHQSTADKIYQIYKKDFDIFGYSPKFEFPQSNNHH